MKLEQKRLNRINKIHGYKRGIKLAHVIREGG